MREATTVPSGRRADIQALRAAAVLLVVLDHAFGWPSGGFVGVDVFYVISGFLITSHLVREGEREGVIDFWGFYRRRFLRLLPAAVVVAAITVVTAYVVFFRARADQIMLDALAALSFAENWHLSALGTNYLQVTTSPSPLQHYWSLSVEEQFYAVWPAVIGVLLLLSRRVRLLSPRVVVAATAVLLALLSVGWAWHDTRVTPAAAYFNTAGRVWELMVGALVGLVGTRVTAGGRTRVILAVGGFLGIVASSIVLDSASSVPWPGVAAPVLCSALVIWAAAGTISGWFERVVSLRPITLVGDTSYSIYLWHFPVLILAWAVVGRTTLISMLCCALTVGLAYLSWRYVETPFIRGSGRPQVAPGAGRIRGVALLTPVVVVALVAASTYVQKRGPASVRDATAFQEELGARQVEDVGRSADEPSATRLATMISHSLGMTQWPRTDPSAALPPELSFGPAMQMEPPGCRHSVGTWRARPHVCSYGAGRRTVMVVGDSVAMSWVATVRSVFEPLGWQIKAVGYANCAFTSAIYTSRLLGRGQLDDCIRARGNMIESVRRFKPALLVVSAEEGAPQRLLTGAQGSLARREWRDGLVREIRRVAHNVERVAILSNPPQVKDPSACAVRVRAPQRCNSTIDSNYRSKAAAESAAARILNGLVPTTYIDSSGWFCAHDRCPLVVGTTLMHGDATHITNAANILVSGAAAPRLLEAAVQGDDAPTRSGHSGG